jgi:glycerophosphoryl diester phosphodiesterase
MNGPLAAAFEIESHPFPLIFAHRGYLAAAPENSLAAFRAVVTHRLPAVELDVHLSRDGALVVIHDATLERTAAGRGAVADLEWEDLAKIELLGGGRLCRLETVLDLLRPHPVELIVEAKDRADGSLYPELSRVLARTLASSGMAARCRITAFNWGIVEALRAIDPSLRLVGVLGPSNTGRYGEVAVAAQRLAALGGREIALHWKLVTPEAVAAVRGAGLGLGAWTPNAPEDHRQLAALGVDWIITDRPDVALAALGGEEEGAA